MDESSLDDPSESPRQIYRGSESFDPARETKALAAATLLAADREPMEVSCPACQARYTADDEKLRGRTARMRCKACQTVWVVSSKETPASIPGSIPMSHAGFDGETSAPSEKRAAVVGKGDERDKRDLFAERDPDAAPFKQTLLPAPSFGLTSVGARNESSVLFSLDQLRSSGSASNSAPPPAASAPTTSRPNPLGNDDEGVIDLMALSSRSPRVSAAPLFSEPPAVALDVDESPVALGTRIAQKKRLFAGVAAAAAFVLVAGIALSFAFKGEEPVQHSAATASPALPEPAPPPAAEAKPAEPAAPPAAAAAHGADEPKDATDPKLTKGKKGKRGKGVKSAATANKVAVAASKPAPTPKAADPCGCKGDFNCAIACSARGGK